MEIRSGMPLCLTLSDPDGNSILVSGAVPEAARSKETTEEMVRQSLSKLGGTPYYLKKRISRWAADWRFRCRSSTVSGGKQWKSSQPKEAIQKQFLFLLRR